MVRVTTLDEIRDEAAGNAYPRAILPGLRTALVLFASGFMGRQDAYWIHEAGLVATCVDVRTETLYPMAELYPDDWHFIPADVYDFAPAASVDLVSVDCPSGQFARCAEHLGTWCSWATRYVVLGTGPYIEIDPPLGWDLIERRYRSDYAGGVEWAVLGRA